MCPVPLDVYSVMVIVFSALSVIFQIYRGGQIYWWGKPKYQEKTIDISQVTDKLYHIILNRVHLPISGNQTHNVSGDNH